MLTSEKARRNDCVWPLWLSPAFLLSTDDQTAWDRGCSSYCRSDLVTDQLIPGNEALVERETALAWAGSVRSTRYQIREQLRSEELTLSELLQLAQKDARVGQIKLLWALESFPGARKVDTRRQLGKLQISEMILIDELNPTSTNAVLASFLPLAQIEVTR